MKRWTSLLAVSAFALSLSGLARADDAKVKEVLDKAIKALGGEEKLAKTAISSWKGKAKIKFQENENELTLSGTVQGIEKFRSEFEGDFGGNTIKGESVLNGDKGWRKFGDMAMEMDPDAVKNEKRNVYLIVAHSTILPLKKKEFKVESAADEKVEGKDASVLKITGPDGKDFTLYFDKESGLPIRQVAKVIGFQGDEYTQESNFSDFKDYDGIKRASKVSVKRDGEPFMTQEVTEFKTLDSVKDDTFAEPK